MKTAKTFEEKKKRRNKMGICAEQFRYVVRLRDDFKCQKCGEKGRDIHHIITVGSNPGLKYDLNNVLYLCRNCHNKLHKNGWQDWFQDKFPRRWVYLQNVRNIVKYHTDIDFNEERKAIKYFENKLED